MGNSTQISCGEYSIPAFGAHLCGDVAFCLAPNQQVQTDVCLAPVPEKHVGCVAGEQLARLFEKAMRLGTACENVFQKAFTCPDDTCPAESTSSGIVNTSTTPVELSCVSENPSDAIKNKEWFQKGHAKFFKKWEQTLSKRLEQAKKEKFSPHSGCDLYRKLTKFQDDYRLFAKMWKKDFKKMEQAGDATFAKCKNEEQEFLCRWIGALKKEGYSEETLKDLFQARS
jgi:hypothetical protein